MFRPPVRLLFPSALLSVGILVLLSVALTERARAIRAVESNMLERSRVLATILGGGIESAYRRGNPDQARDLFQLIHNDRTVSLATLVNKRGVVEFSSQFTLRDHSLGDTPLRRFKDNFQNVLASGTPVSQVTHDGEKLVGLYPIALLSDTLSLTATQDWVLILQHDLTIPKQAATWQAINYVLVVGTAVLILALGSWWLFHVLIMRRVDGLLAFTRRVSASPAPEALPDLDTQGSDELGQISQAACAMARRLLNQHHSVEAARRFLNAALDAMPAGVVVMNQEGVLVSTNRAWREMSEAQPPDEQPVENGLSYLAYLDARARAGDTEARHVALRLRSVLSGQEETAIFDYRRHVQGQEHVINLRARRFEFDDQVMVLTAHVDVTESRLAARNAARAERRYRSLYNENPSMFFTIDPDLNIASVNDYGATQLGYQATHLVGIAAHQLYPPSEQRDIERRLRQCLDEPHTVHRWETDKLCFDGSTFRARETGRYSPGTFGEGGILIVCEDISEADALSRELKKIATIDPLTGLLNRFEFERRLQELIDDARDTGSEHALAFIDLDQFKIINDTSGHIAGDELLRQVASMIGARVRKEDTLARLGGDEFAVLMSHCSIAQATRVASTLCRSLEDFRFSWDNQAFIIGASIGITRIDAHTQDGTEALRTADAACYAAKDGGRNQVRVYEPEDAEFAQRHGEMRWLSEVQSAMDRGDIVLYAQPISACAGNGCGDTGHHYEVLIRLRGKSNDLHSPGAFLPAVERYGLAPRLDRWVIETYLAWLARNPRHLDTLQMAAINLSGNTIADDTFPGFVRDAARRHGVRYEKLCFEVTETAAIANLSQAAASIEALRTLGASVALDDFGTGMCSFGYLKSLPVDFLKIDGVFVKDIADDPVDAAMVRSINEIGQLLGKTTVAEFVESPEILVRLHEIGVDYAQGYAIGRPMPLDRLTDAALPPNVVSITQERGV